MLTNKMTKGFSEVPILMWIAGATISLVATIALTFSTTTTSTVAQIQQVDNVQNQAIDRLKNSECVQNANMKNLAEAVKASFVSDPNCN